MDKALHTAVKGYIDGNKAESFASFKDLRSMFKEMEGKLYVCAPFAQSHHCISEVDEFIDAGMLVLRAKDSTVFTY
jgi:hypothetical protein